MLKKLFLVLLLIATSRPAYSQWEEIADFLGPNPSGIPGGAGQIITCVYFLDSASQIGFVGTHTTLYRTSDGGSTWIPVWDSGESWYNYCVTDISFKNGTTGWFTVCNGDANTGDACYRTTDGGVTWKLLSVQHAQGGATAICYTPLTNRLIISTADTGNIWGLLEYSSDLGDSWHFLSSYETAGFSFFSDSVGIASAAADDSLTYMMRTMDGGQTWNLVDSGAWCYLPLAIPGTSICFEADQADIIRRSDDYGQTWRVVKVFSPVWTLGVIRGNLSRLYVQTDSGIYISLDSGSTWVLEPGSPTRLDGDSYFYAAHGRTIAGKTINNGALLDGGLWEEIWPQSGVTEQPVAVGSNALRIFPNPTSGSITIEAASGPVTIFDPLGRSYTVPRMAGEGASPRRLDVSTLAPGVYFVSDGVSRTKFVKE